MTLDQCPAAAEVGSDEPCVGDLDAVTLVDITGRAEVDACARHGAQLRLRSQMMTDET